MKNGFLCLFSMKVLYSVFSEFSFVAQNIVHAHTHESWKHLKKFLQNNLFSKQILEILFFVRSLPNLFCNLKSYLLKQKIIFKNNFQIEPYIVVFPSLILRSSAFL